MTNGKIIKPHHVLWIICAIVIGIIVASLALKSAGYDRISEIADLNNIEQNQDKKGPGYFYFIKDPNKQPTVRADAYLVGDLDTGEIIFAKNKDQKLSIASVSKLFTATVSEDIQEQSGLAKISSSALAAEGENGGFWAGEKIKISDLIYPMLLESSNDAAEAIAEFSGRNNFIERMNEKAQDLGLTSTSFQDPSGLSGGNQSTVSDLFKFTQYLEKNKKDLMDLTTKRSYNNSKHSWFNTSQFLGMEGYLGGKRGYTYTADQTALSAFALPLGEMGTRNIGIIVLHTPDRYQDVKNIYNFLKRNVYYGLETDANLAWVKTKEGIIEETELNFVTLAFGGDVMLDRGVKNSVMKNFGGDYSALFQNLDVFQKADISFVNIEGPASDQGTDRHNLYSFRMDPSIVPALQGAGLSVVSAANNHVGDWGRDAYADTLSRLNENEIKYVGGGNDKNEAEQPAIIEKNGIKIGYLGFTDVGPDWMEANSSSPGVLLASDPNFDQIIKNASSKVDFLIVSFHFGEEYQKQHNTRQENLAERAIDNGAKIVVGAHPHVVQDTEVYKNSYIAYSLGNLIFDQYFSESTMQGMILEIKLYKDGRMTAKKDSVSLSRFFQPEKIISGKEEQLKFQ